MEGYTGNMSSRFLLVEDYLKRAEKRIKTLEFLYNLEDYADVVREAQETVELLLKGLIMMVGLEVPKVHDVSRFIEPHLELFPKVIVENFQSIKKISRTLRKERELSFYGTLDWIPSEEYNSEDAERAISWAKKIYQWVKAAYKEIRSS